MTRAWLTAIRFSFSLSGWNAAAAVVKDTRCFWLTRLGSWKCSRLTQRVAASQPSEAPSRMNGCLGSANSRRNRS